MAGTTPVSFTCGVPWEAGSVIRNSNHQKWKEKEKKKKTEDEFD
jgi:hypothetical protein